MIGRAQLCPLACTPSWALISQAPLHSCRWVAASRPWMLLGCRWSCERPHQVLWAGQPQSGGHTGSEPRGVVRGARGKETQLHGCQDKVQPQGWGSLGLLLPSVTDVSLTSAGRLRVRRESAPCQPPLAGSMRAPEKSFFGLNCLGFPLSAGPVPELRAHE